MRAPNRAPGTTWLMRRLGDYPNGEVRTAAGDRVEVTFYNVEGYGKGFSLTRRDARLLAKRINQCLDGTVRR